MGEIQPEIYILNRDAEESARLNCQHDFLLEVYGNNLIHPSIPKSNIQSVADIATGTGIWLRDAATVLGMWNRNPSSPYYLHGFDISSAQFQPLPTQTNAEISLSLQNCLEPFSSEHHGRYDFVHVRLLIGALRKGEYELAIKNIFDILKPGGYFQWEETDMDSIESDISPQPPSLIEARRLLLSSLDKSDLYTKPAEHIKSEAKCIGFSNLHIVEYSSTTRPHLRDRSRAWLTRALQSVMPMAMIRLGKASEEDFGKEMAKELMAEFESECAEAIVGLNMDMVIGKKPERLESVL
ncbi:putative LaeA-like methyltransferase [Aspergillus glaucus CBS 516.65]|uniref:Methyltransferase domain-containing protein n=1 Tax=Aspergillus glaucus CBS 516.65 TaxID=1160497 RepID=A0A1L9VPX7_ASPGL|nr:hypothetical protein ASPGLDRAFT_44911 [Aspergillus glaucus CBS 516.65]OJJ85940.1 hypothetical protein ASPGLDRAFT_44911 [Aspergillus glaucus CBS 516.65]